MDKVWPIIAIIFIVAFSVVLIFTLLVTKKWRAPYIGSVHVLRDNSDGESYMFLVIEKGRDQYIQHNKIVRIRVIEDTPPRGKDRDE